jgi:hypothetical protein
MYSIIQFITIFNLNLSNILYKICGKKRKTNQLELFFAIVKVILIIS